MAVDAMQGDEATHLKRDYFESATRRAAIGLAIALPIFSLILHAKAADASVTQLIVLPADIALATVLFVLVIPMIRAEVRIGETGVTVRNKRWKEYSLKWNEIRHFSFGDEEAAVLDQVAVVELVSGDRIPLHALYTANQFLRPDSRYARDQCSELQRAKRLADENGGSLPRQLLEG